MSFAEVKRTEGQMRLRRRVGWSLIFLPSLAVLGFLVYRFGLEVLIGILVLGIVIFIMLINGLVMVLDGK